MSEFKSWQSYWEFAQATTRRTRYVHDPGVEEFLQTVRESCKKQIETIPANRVWWRAQLGHAHQPMYEDEDFPYPAERMKPLRDRAGEGRANPKGIPYLYLSTKRETALAEVRPWIGSLISVGAFEILRELRIVNCTTDVHNIVYFEEPLPDEREKAVWFAIDRAFSRPVDPADDVAAYVPTQILAELFKAEGYDGIGYRSSLGPGHNIALFDLDVADLIACLLFEVKDISFKFEQRPNSYQVKDHIGNKDPGGT
ncbi:MAG: RES family NAD+ phosphorylase [Thermodesulfobacteriota bacterium]|nr:RES family NAD+ phosphorylase [Thermodesulfobacteriota bacterium]